MRPLWAHGEASRPVGTRKSEPKPDRFEFMSPEGRKLAEDFERDRAALKADLDKMTREMDAIMPALDEVTAQLAAEDPCRACR